MIMANLSVIEPYGYSLRKISKRLQQKPAKQRTEKLNGADKGLNGAEDQ